jgi:putative transcriptional regulator
MGRDATGSAGETEARHNSAMEESVRGRLLIAAPSLFDYFRRTVVLVIEHTPDGGMGLVLNRTSETPVAEAVPALADLVDEAELVRVGGPVAPQAVVALGEFEDASEAGVRVVGSVGTLDPDAANESLLRLRVYAGYAGWSPGQLDGEIEEGAWIVASAEAEDPFRDGDIWSDALTRQGGRYRLLATMPSDPSLN